MKDTIYIVSNASRVLRMSRSIPKIGVGEVAIKMTVAVPDDAYRTKFIQATIDVPLDRVIIPVASVEIAEP